MRYEVICELFNNCSGKARPFFEEVEGRGVAEFIRSRTEHADSVERTDLPDGSIVYDVVDHGVRQRYTFTPS